MRSPRTMMPWRLSRMDASVVEIPTYAPIPPIVALSREAVGAPMTDCVSERRILRGEARGAAAKRGTERKMQA